MYLEENKTKEDYKRDLSNTKVLRMKELPDVVGAKSSTIYTWIREGKFPAPKKCNAYPFGIKMLLKIG